MRIGFTGVAGGGKTTLVNELFKLDEYKDYVHYTNVQRKLHHYLGNKFPHSSQTNNITQSSISSNIVLQLLEHPKLISDRSLIDTFVYARLSNFVTDWENIENTFSKGLELYDVIFFIPKEFETPEDGLRETNIDYVNSTDTAFKEYVEKYKHIVNIVPLSGTVEERLNTIISTLDNIKSK